MQFILPIVRPFQSIKELNMSRVIARVPFAGNGILSTVRFVSGVGVSVSGAGLLMSEAIRAVSSAI
jgi:hypothetical protein